MSAFHTSLNSPVGPLTLFEDAGAVTAVEWGRAPSPRSTPLLDEAARQLTLYFDGALDVFDLPLAPRGTAFRQRVWRAMLDIPYGRTETYGAMAARIGADGTASARAVGGACGANPIPILIPCHRVVGAGGRMTGYSAGRGIETKRALLRLEGAALL
ncbi:MAG: cysteine methyltransferase [Rhodospirillales bacterium CG15_BIG_FIL_POST_REV_8_21_14_020_66_15]|nr:MAG: cysteine methyltransferase [Rhodospirillales bacterium CG15_BIG_FIL_POST_REV_8_21_14_020_66_15]